MVGGTGRVLAPSRLGSPPGCCLASIVEGKTWPASSFSSCARQFDTAWVVVDSDQLRGSARRSRPQRCHCQLAWLARPSRPTASLASGRAPRTPPKMPSSSTSTVVATSEAQSHPTATSLDISPKPRDVACCLSSIASLPNTNTQHQSRMPSPCTGGCSTKESAPNASPSAATAPVADSRQPPRSLFVISNYRCRRHLCRSPHGSTWRASGPVSRPEPNSTRWSPATRSAPSPPSSWGQTETPRTRSQLPYTQI